MLARTITADVAGAGLPIAQARRLVRIVVFRAEPGTVATVRIGTDFIQHPAASGSDRFRRMCARAVDASIVGAFAVVPVKYETERPILHRHRPALALLIANLGRAVIRVGGTSLTWRGDMRANALQTGVARAFVAWTREPILDGRMGADILVIADVMGADIPIIGARESGADPRPARINGVNG